MTTAIRGVSMPATVQRSNGRRNYAAGDPVGAIAAEFNCTRATAAQMLKFADQRNPVPRLTRMVAALTNAGCTDAAERLCFPVDVARRHLKLVPESEIVPDAAHLDSWEEILENQYRSNPCPDTRRRWLKGLKDAHAKEGELIATLEAECAEAQQ